MISVPICLTSVQQIGAEAAILQDVKGRQHLEKPFCLTLPSARPYQDLATLMTSVTENTQ